MGQKSILVICATMSYQKRICDILQLNEFKVTTASEGFHALSLLDTEVFSLVVIGPDVRVMGANEVLSLIRSKFSKTTLPIIRILSESGKFLKESEMQDLTNSLESNESLKLGANEVFKEFDPRKLIKKINKILSAC
ncbi:MAG: hypothetical protein HQK51_09640 [Oligoflexia bacterium]|nr:hypothetical protein [Oligoflexia bacterium]